MIHILFKYNELKFLLYNLRKWTKEEDEILIQAVDLYGEKNWQQGK